MASVQKTKEGTWRVQFYVGNSKRQKTFKTRAEANKFSLELESSPRQLALKYSLKSLLQKYKKEITPKKKSAKAEGLRIDRFCRLPMANLPIGEVDKAAIQQYIYDRLDAPNAQRGGLISPSTVLKEVNLLSAVFNFAINLGWMKENPCHGVKKPKEPEHRERVASAEDIEKLLVASGWDGKREPKNATELTIAAFLFACKTGMRAGEIVALEDSWIEGCVIHLPKEATKTDARRDVALSKEAVKILKLVRGRKRRTTRVFEGLSLEIREALWRKIRNRAGLGPVKDSQGRVVKEGLNFHDARATFATWAASPDPKTGAPRLDVLALARQTGHKNLTMLQRYYRAGASEIAHRLDS